MALRTNRTSVRVGDGSGSYSVYANSNDRSVFQILEDSNTPLDLTGYNVGMYLLTGSSRATATCRRPTPAQSVRPSYTGISVLCAAEGLVEYEYQVADFTNSDTALWMELVATKQPTTLAGSASGSSGDFTSEGGVGTYTYYVTNMIDGVESMYAEVDVAVGSNTNSVALTWTDHPDATSAKVYRKNQDNTIKSLGTQVSGYSDPGAAGSTSALPTSDPFYQLLAQFRVTVKPN